MTINTDINAQKLEQQAAVIIGLALVVLGVAVALGTRRPIPA